MGKIVLDPLVFGEPLHYNKARDGNTDNLRDHRARNAQILCDSADRGPSAVANL